jgi:predicted regulator of Ras-like GTPase activity (Roadblock/LC7/MglB family)
MGRESSEALEQTALSFLSGIDPELGLDAALFVRRTGLVLASWTREGIRLDVVSVMAATMLASVDTIIEAIGGPTPDVISVDTDAHQVVATKVTSRAFLVVIAPKTVSRTVVRKTMRGLNARLAEAASKSTHPTFEETEKQRVNVRPPR